MSQTPQSVAAAHSARKGYPLQSYPAHVWGILKRALEALGQLLPVPNAFIDRLARALTPAATYHDVGKLAEPNQAVLNGEYGQALPLWHSDAGTRWLLQSNDPEAALLVHAHHAGLPNVRLELRNGFRAPSVQRGPVTASDMAKQQATWEDTDKHLATHVQRHVCELGTQAEAGRPVTGLTGLQRRLTLSCLVEGDHGDTAAHYGWEPPPPPAGRWVERLEALDRYVATLGMVPSPRNALRQEVYATCRNGALPPSLVVCTGAFGVGKTTALMATCLRLAAAHNLRHVLVVLPLTSIIHQSVAVYRKALTLPGEDPLAVVGEHHHALEFSSLRYRYLTTLWNQPIIVTTSVQFFETILAASATRLRKLCQLPGSAILVDEAHAAMPVENWPLALQTMRELVADWNCHFVLASGSLAAPWQLARLVGQPYTVPDILPAELRQRVEAPEQERVHCYWAGARAWGYDEFLAAVKAARGPRLVILNTVQSAALVAKHLRDHGEDVLHLSTALVPRDREVVLARIHERLRSPNTNWCLVATSCVEAGMDFDFHVAFREAASALSMLQVLGRVNREGTRECAEVVVFQLKDGDGLIHHPGLTVSTRVLQTLFAEGWFEGGRTRAEISTEALRREVEYSPRDLLGKAVKAEQREDYPEVEQLARVIKEQTVLVLVDQELVARLRRGEQVMPRELERVSARMWAPKAYRLRLEALEREHEPVYCWNRDYDPEFLGYMAGLLGEIAGITII